MVTIGSIPRKTGPFFKGLAGHFSHGAFGHFWGLVLFLHDLVWQLDVKGRHVAMVPDRNVRLVTGSEDHEGLRRIAAEAKHILEHSPRPMTGLAFIAGVYHLATLLAPGRESRVR
jgi:hypothetical protein